MAEAVAGDGTVDQRADLAGRPVDRAADFDGFDRVAHRLVELAEVRVHEPHVAERPGEQYRPVEVAEQGVAVVLAADRLTYLVAQGVVDRQVAEDGNRTEGKPGAPVSLLGCV
ncbi:hypothetical protein, partial [Streptomyces bicolor]|uniref:hypothetical protein n=1 Tax=Streptomyces bicolor TaxID=66874 RepID=UPI00131B51AC